MGHRHQELEGERHYRKVGRLEEAHSHFLHHMEEEHFHRTLVHLGEGYICCLLEEDLLEVVHLFHPHNVAVLVASRIAVSHHRFHIQDFSYHRKEEGHKGYVRMDHKVLEDHPIRPLEVHKD